MEDEAAIIYGLEFQARALSAQVAENEAVCFLVGTQSLKFDNQIHHLEFDEESNQLSKTVYLHGSGEVWHLSCSPTQKNIFASCYTQITPEGKCEMHGSIWKLPDHTSGDSSPQDDTSTAFPSLEKLTKLDTSKFGSELSRIIWEPSEGERIVSLVDNNLLLWDLKNSGQDAVLAASTSVDLKGKPKLTSANWNPHQSCTVVAVAVDTGIRAFDIRTMKPAWQIDSAHGQLVRELDFNPNKQYYLATCGDDCQAKFWDIRNTSNPVLVLTNHSHWVWSIRYNHFHDQLLLTSSSDSRVVLSRVASISSEPFGHLVDDEDVEEPKKKVEQDGVIATYEEHEDSVYAVEWSTADPWLFASLSYDGRLVINKVPRAEKYRILL